MSLQRLVQEGGAPACLILGFSTAVLPLMGTALTGARAVRARVAWPGRGWVRGLGARCGTLGGRHEASFPSGSSCSERRAGSMLPGCAGP
jgi:hypothetical protein